MPVYIIDKMIQWSRVNRRFGIHLDSSLGDTIALVQGRYKYLFMSHRTSCVEAIMVIGDKNSNWCFRGGGLGRILKIRRYGAFPFFSAVIAFNAFHSLEIGYRR